MHTSPVMTHAPPGAHSIVSSSLSPPSSSPPPPPSPPPSFPVPKEEWFAFTASAGQRHEFLLSTEPLAGVAALNSTRPRTRAAAAAASVASASGEPVRPRQRLRESLRVADTLELMGELRPRSRSVRLTDAASGGGRAGGAGDLEDAPGVYTVKGMLRAPLKLQSASLAVELAIGPFATFDAALAFLLLWEQGIAASNLSRDTVAYHLADNFRLCIWSAALSSAPASPPESKE